MRQCSRNHNRQRRRRNREREGKIAAQTPCPLEREQGEQAQGERARTQTQQVRTQIRGADPDSGDRDQLAVTGSEAPGQVERESTRKERRTDPETHPQLRRGPGCAGDRVRRKQSDQGEDNRVRDPA